MRVMIIEDEIPTRRMLVDKVKELRPKWKIVAQAGSVDESVEWLSNNLLPDLLFMDVQLSDGLCFEIFEQVKIPAMVIFTTAYDEYAIQAFSVNSIDYLLKPIQDQKLEDAFLKFERMTNLGRALTADQIDFNQLANTLTQQVNNYRSRFLVNLIDGFKILPVNEISRFESANKILSAFTFDEQHHILDFSLDQLEKELDPQLFFRANRQYIIHILSIKKVETWFNGKLVVKTQPPTAEKLVVSRERARSFKEWIDR